MVVGICTIRLSIPANHDLKGKRRVLQSLMAKMRESFNVSVAEVDEQDKWQAATLGVVAVSSDQAYLHGLLAKVVKSLEHARSDASLLDFEIEMLGV
ncbi:MAG: DUF503 domain-containing protein [Chloroflexi bacterium]|nr:MAG: DUF503 domain-containing protein [Chloroflexota bacterium]